MLNLLAYVLPTSTWMQILGGELEGDIPFPLYDTLHMGMQLPY